jgi:hypothetical protein
LSPPPLLLLLLPSLLPAPLASAAHPNWLASRFETIAW